MSGISRRGVLSGAAGLSAAAAAGACGANASAEAKPAAAPAYVKGLPDVVIAGAGVFGAWTALSLVEKGAKVLLVDAYGPGNARQTSGDETRQIRYAYGEDEIYSRWAYRALQLWTERQEEFGRDMIYRNGVLAADSPMDKVETETAIFRKLGIPYEILKQDELRARWPQARWDDVDYALYEPEAGTVKARESIVAVSEVFRQKGGAVRIGYATPGASAGGKLTDVVLGDGERLSAGKFLFACGPWLPTVLPDILDGYIRLRRSEVFYIGSPRGDDSYSYRKLPNMWEPYSGAYAMSDIDYGYKVVPRFGVEMDPDTDERVVSTYLIDKARDYLKRRLPGLAGQPVVASRVCVLENSNNHHYIIDTHPDYENMWVAGAGSGHAFKMGPMLGEYVSERVIGTPDDPAVRALFALDTHGPVEA